VAALLQIEALLDAAPAPHALIGSSMGGYLAALLASRDPRIERLFFYPGRESARHNGCSQKREQGQPVLWIGDRKRANRGEKEEVITGCRRKRSRNSVS